MNTMVPRIYVVDDDASVREAVAGLLRTVGWHVQTFASADDVWSRVRREPPHCLVLDIDLPGLSGLDLQEQLVKAHLPIPIVFLTGKGDIRMSVRAIKAGAVEFLTKPFVGEHLLDAVRQGLDQARTLAGDSGSVSWSYSEPEPPSPARHAASRKASPRDGEIVGTSASVRHVLSRVAKVGPTDSTVLITGETGTGKELLAREIHQQSRRADGPFVALNCAAIPQALIGSELFGHEKGAFTGAIQRRLGRFELAHGGTLFLDEIGELPPEVQVTLLRVLQEREFERVGGTELIRVNVRVITATHRDLRAEMAAGKFRSDLFYRLNVFPLEVPPLRERREDIPALAQFFVERVAGRLGKSVRCIDAGAMRLLQAYAWPGNIRELQNVIERSVITCDGGTLFVDEACLRAEAPLSRTRTQHLGARIAEQEREMIEEALRECRGRVAGPWGAAVRLGMPASTLDSKIASLKIDKHRFKSAASDGFHDAAFAAA